MTPGASRNERNFHGQRCVEIVLPQGDRALISLFGAQVLSWQPAGFSEQFYLSPRREMNSSTAIRGGVPICFPQFNQRVLDGLRLPKHGFARTEVWTPQQPMSTETFAEAGFVLSSISQTSAEWPHDFSATVTVRLEPGRLRTHFAVRNTGPSTWRFALALHTYLAVNDVNDTQLHGLGGCRYWDTVEDLHKPHSRREQAPGPLFFAGETDRIYTGAEAPLELRSTGGSLRITQSASMPDTVVWNPGAVLCATISDMPPDGWKNMVCVEAARIHDPQRLTAGESWSGWQQLECIPRV